MEKINLFEYKEIGFANNITEANKIAKNYADKFPKVLNKFVKQQQKFAIIEINNIYKIYIQKENYQLAHIIQF